MFKGHPKGLYVFLFANMGERFGYYTMIAIFTLFLQAKFGMSAKEAGHVYGMFLFGIYFIPLIGGFLADKVLPLPLVILLYFGLLSAVISSADTTLLTAASTFSQIFIKDLREENAIKITRIFILIFGILSILVALKFLFILPTLLLALAVYSGAFIVPCLAGIFGYKCKKNYAILAILLGGGIALYGKILGGDIGNFIIIGSFIVNFVVLMSGRRKI